MTEEEFASCRNEALGLLKKLDSAPQIPPDDLERLSSLTVLFGALESAKIELPVRQEFLDNLMFYMMAAYNLGADCDWETWSE